MDEGGQLLGLVRFKPAREAPQDDVDLRRPGTPRGHASRREQHLLKGSAVLTTGQACHRSPTRQALRGGKPTCGQKQGFTSGSDTPEAFACRLPDSGVRIRKGRLEAALSTPRCRPGQRGKHRGTNARDRIGDVEHQERWSSGIRHVAQNVSSLLPDNRFDVTEQDTQARQAVLRPVPRDTAGAKRALRGRGCHEPQRLPPSERQGPRRGDCGQGFLAGGQREAVGHALVVGQPLPGVRSDTAASGHGGERPGQHRHGRQGDEAEGMRPHDETVPRTAPPQTPGDFIKDSF